MMPTATYNFREGYRYGFNGQEKDNEVKGAGNSYDFGFRFYDSRIGRPLSIDPLLKKFPELTPYQFFSNSPIMNIDLEGLEKFAAIVFSNEQIFGKRLEKMTFKQVENFVISANEPVKDPFIQMLVNLSKSDPQGIGFLALFSHGSRNGNIFPNQQTAGIDAGDISISDLDEIEQLVKDGVIKFTEGAKIYLGGCNCGTNAGGTSFADRLAEVTGAEVLAIAGDRVSSLIARKEGNLIFTPSDEQDTEFKRFKKHEFPKSAGRKINVIDEFLGARRSTTMLEKVTPKNALNIGTTSNLQPIARPNTLTNEKLSRKDAKVLFKNISKE